MIAPPGPASIGVIDAHVHVFPPHFVSARDDFIARDRWFELLYTNPMSLLATAESLIEAMDNAGVERAVLCGFPWSDGGICREHNTYMAEAVAQFPNRLSWLGIVVPTAEDGVSDAGWCLENGASGLGELNADAQGFDWRNPASFEGVIRLCVESNRPVLVHASEAVGHAYPGKGTATPERLLPFIERFPDLKLVAAHWGGGLPFFELMPEVAALTANVVYDCAASSYLYRSQVFRSVLDIVGPDRVLFGSDYPVLRMDRFLSRVHGLNWRDDHERDAVLSLNARRIFALDVPDGDGS